MPRIPAYDPQTDVVQSPHVVIVGAGASRATCPSGDRNGLKLPVMNDLVDVVGLSSVFESEGLTELGDNFEDIYDNLASSKSRVKLRAEIESHIRGYFARLELPTSPTIYDYLLLSLQEKDLIATFNWDPLLPQAYMRNSRAAKLPRIAFLHGNVSLGVCASDRVQGWLGSACRKCRKPFVPSELLFPVRQKNYNSSPQLTSEWKGLRFYLEHAYFLTIFGYSAPTSDAAAVNQMRRTWSQNPTKELAQTEIIDIKGSQELHATWKRFIVRSHYITPKRFNDSYLAWHPRRSCDALFAATLMNDPWPDDWMPTFETLSDLHTWIEPLVHEENASKGFKRSVRET